MSLFDRLWLLISQALSARAWRQRNDGWSNVRVRIDAALGDGHCERAYFSQVKRQKARET